MDYEELSGHYQIGLKIQTLMFKKNGEFIEIDLNSVSEDVWLDYQKREYTLLDNEIDDNCIISGKDIINKLSDGSIENFAFSHRTIVREILQKNKKFMIKAHSKKMGFFLAKKVLFRILYLLWLFE